MYLLIALQEMFTVGEYCCCCTSMVLWKRWHFTVLTNAEHVIPKASWSVIFFLFCPGLSFSHFMHAYVCDKSLAILYSTDCFLSSLMLSVCWFGSSIFALTVGLKALTSLRLNHNLSQNKPPTFNGSFVLHICNLYWERIILCVGIAVKVQGVRDTDSDQTLQLYFCSL